MNAHQTNLRALEVKQLEGGEHFRHRGIALPQNIADFWRWAYSNLAANNLRGHLAEFLVASDINAAKETRIEWDDYDLRTQSGIKIEVKSASFLQSWSQSKLSSITFGIAPSRAYNTETETREKECARNADVYVFCLLAHKVKQTLDPTNLDQWEFYVLPTQILDAKLGNQQTLSLGRLLSLSPAKCSYGEISDTIDNVVRATPISNLAVQTDAVR